MLMASPVDLKPPQQTLPELSQANAERGAVMTPKGMQSSSGKKHKSTSKISTGVSVKLC